MSKATGKGEPKTFNTKCYSMTSSTLAVMTQSMQDSAFVGKTTPEDHGLLISCGYNLLPTLSLFYNLLATTANRGEDHVPRNVPGEYRFFEFVGPKSAFLLSDLSYKICRKFCGNCTNVQTF